MGKKYEVTADLEYVQGHLRYGHMVMTMNEDEYQHFSKLSEENQQDYLDDYGELVVDDWEVYSRGELEDIQVTFKEEKNEN